MILHKVTTLTKCDSPPPPLSINGKGKCFLVFDQTTLPARRVVESFAFFLVPALSLTMVTGPLPFFFSPFLGKNDPGLTDHRVHIK